MIDRTQPDPVEEALRRRASSTAPPMRETHVEVRRRILERAHAARVVAEKEYREARDRYDELFPKPDERSEALMEAVQAMPTAKADWTARELTSKPIKTEMPHLDFADRALDTQVGGAHYKSMAIQPVEFIDRNKIPYLEGNAIKYICRHAEKNGVQDIDKAIHYLQLLKELRYGTAK